MFLLSVLVKLLLAAITRAEQHYERQLLPDGVNVTTFDYVIVGAGTGGAALASRLSQDPSVTVALIEAGGDYHITDPVFANTPGGDILFCGWSPADTNFIDWQFQTKPQAGAAERVMHFARGRCLGGSSARNFMIYQRGTKSSYDEWETLGNPGWGWEDLLPYFKKSVHFTPPNDSLRGTAGVDTRFNLDAFSPSGGPLQLSYPNFAQPLAPWLRAGLNEIGLANATDFSSGELNGTAFAPATIASYDESRSSSATSFLAAAQERTNLVVFQNTMAMKLTFDGNRSTGVDISPLTQSILGETTTIYANREVIISAGAFQSPQLLMLSGIGPRDQLEQFGIPVLHENPNVGQNMQDHPFFAPSYPTSVDTLTKLAHDPIYLAEQFLLYETNATGVFTNNVADLIGWERFSDELLEEIGATKVAQEPEGWPTVEYINAPGYIGSFSDLLLTQPITPNDQQYASVIGVLVSPQSRGNVTLAGPTAITLPDINPNWLTDSADKAIAIQLFKRLRRVLSSKAMSPIITGPEFYPGATVQTDSEILEWIHNNVMTLWHPACTCAMLPEEQGGVVDAELKVYGTENVRVVDASAFSKLPPGHPQSTIYMMAEKAADMIVQARSRSKT